MVVFEEGVIKLTVVDVLLHTCLELGQLLFNCRHFWRWHSNVDLRQRNSVFWLGFSRTLSPWLSLGGALLLVVRWLGLSVDPVIRDLASKDALVLLVQVVDVYVQPILKIRQIVVHSQRSHIFSGLASILRVWQRLNMPSVDLFRVVASYPEWRSFAVELVPEWTQVSRSLIHSILVELQKALSLSWVNLLSFNCGINSSISRRSSWVFQQVVDSVVFEVHDSVGCVFFICHF